jgi:hypothetical protein
MQTGTSLVSQILHTEKSEIETSLKGVEKMTDMR